jgi:hypothetical protein
MIPVARPVICHQKSPGSASFRGGFYRPSNLKLRVDAPFPPSWVLWFSRENVTGSSRFRAAFGADCAEGGDEDQRGVTHVTANGTLSSSASQPPLSSPPNVPDVPVTPRFEPFRVFTRFSRVDYYVSLYQPEPCPNVPRGDIPKTTGDTTLRPGHAPL